jgi:hypothetical protein
MQTYDFFDGSAVGDDGDGALGDGGGGGDGDDDAARTAAATVVAAAVDKAVKQMGK